MNAASDESKTVLLIDDDEASQYIYGAILEHAGYRVERARSGDVAARMLTELDPDLVVMDLGLPGVDGFDLTRSIRANPRTCNVPVLVVTVHIFPQDRRRATEVGSTDFMAKPLDPSALLARVESLIGRPGAGGPS